MSNERLRFQGCPRESETYGMIGTRVAEKYGEIWPTFLETCSKCGIEWESCQAIYEGGQQDYCDGCAGYPFCMCAERHTGSCHRKVGT